MSGLKHYFLYYEIEEDGVPGSLFLFIPNAF